MLKIYYSSVKYIARASNQRAFSVSNKNTSVDPRHSRLVILGAGFSGLVASAYIPKISKVKNFEIRMLDPKLKTVYTPGLDLVPFGLKSIDQIEKPVYSLINNSINIDFSSVKSIRPKDNTIITNDNKEYTYDYLVLATGLTPNIDKVEGLQEALDERDEGVVSLNSEENIFKYKRMLDSFIAGDVIFYNDDRTKSFESALNQAFLFDTYLREERGRGLRQMSNLQYISSSKSLFPHVKYSLQIQDLLREKNIEYDNFGLKLVSINKKSRKAIFQDKNSDKKVEKSYDLLFVNPEYQLPEALQNLKDQNGNLKINNETLVHENYPNILAMGHCTRNNGFIPSKRAILEQGIILSYNLRLILEANSKGQRPEKLVKFSGYTELPLFVEPGKCLKLGVDPKMPDIARRISTWDYYKETYVFPEIYFRLMSRGLWFNDTGFRIPALNTL